MSQRITVQFIGHGKPEVFEAESVTMQPIVTSRGLQAPLVYLNPAMVDSILIEPQTGADVAEEAGKRVTTAVLDALNRARAAIEDGRDSA